jgi:heme exporter protein A
MSSNTPHALEAETLQLWRGERHVLRSVSFSLAGGECLQVRGANGAGKTTLLRAVCGLLQPEAGRILWQGSDVRADLLAYHTRLIYIGHEPPLKPDLNALENLRFWIGVRQPVERAAAQAALQRVGADRFSTRAVRTLSAGQRRRVALAALALLAAPLWLLDEPTTNLDADGQRLVASLIDEHLGRGGLVVTAGHHELPVRAARVRHLELPLE